MTRLLGLALAGLLLAGCSGSSSGEADDGVTKADLQVCVDALDAANAGFIALSEQVTTVQEALRSAFAGDMQSAEAALSTVERVSPDRYKQLEADCRAAAD